MRTLFRFFLIMITAGLLAACLPTTELEKVAAPQATAEIGPALSPLKQVSPLPTTVMPTTLPDPYPMPPTPQPFIDPYPPGYFGPETDGTPQMSEFEIFMETRTAELGVAELDDNMRYEAIVLFEETREAALWRDLNQDQLQHLALSWDPIIQLQPGETHNFQIGLVYTGFRTFSENIAQVQWSSSPEDGASIDPDTGVFSVNADTPHGSVYTVTAHLEDGRASPTIEVYIYTLDENPLIGYWLEEKQIACDSEEEKDPLEIIQEVKFNADGTFSVAWFPFESYKDYWGTYTYDNESGELALTMDEGNYLPTDFDGGGKAYLDDDGRLQLKGIWLGKAQSEGSETNCGHVFVRRQ